MDDVRLGELSLGEIDTVQLLPPSGERLSDVRYDAWVSDIGFAVAIVGAGLGVVGLMTSSKKAPSSARFRVGPGSAFFEGSF